MPTTIGIGRGTRSSDERRLGAPEHYFGRNVASVLSIPESPCAPPSRTRTSRHPVVARPSEVEQRPDYRHGERRRAAEPHGAARGATRERIWLARPRRSRISAIDYGRLRCSRWEQNGPDPTRDQQGARLHQQCRDRTDRERYRCRNRVAAIDGVYEQDHRRAGQPGRTPSSMVLQIEISAFQILISPNRSGSTTRVTAPGCTGTQRRCACSIMCPLDPP